MSARTVSREARITSHQFVALIREVDSAEIHRMSQKFHKFQTVFGTPYWRYDENPFDRLRQQETAVSAHLAERGRWPD